MIQLAVGETNNVRYTEDGKKVYLQSIINSDTALIAEVMIIDGKECANKKSTIININKLSETIPMTWKEKYLQEMTAKLEKQKIDNDNLAIELEKQINTVIKPLKTKLQNLKQLNDKFDVKEFQTFIDYISGEIKYLIVNSVYSLEIIPFNNTVEDFFHDKELNFQGFKLLTINGSTQGDLNFRLHKYAYGSSNTLEIVMCKNKKEVREILITILGKKTIYKKEDFKLFKEYKIKPNPDIVNAYIKTHEKSIQSQLVLKKEQLLLSEKNLEEHQQFVNTIPASWKK